MPTLFHDESPYQEIINLRFTEHTYEQLKPCPWCRHKANLTLENTWTATYWIACSCGVALGDNYSTGNGKHLVSHRRSAQRVFDLWNSRDSEQ